MNFLPNDAQAAVRPSPNHGERRDSTTVRFLLLHYTGMESGKAAEDWLCCAQSEVSCHYIVHTDGRTVQMVPENRRAWHAGASQWDGLTDINSASIGIEIVNDGHPGGCPPYSDIQIDAVIALARNICTRHTIRPWDVLGHSDVAPGRKIDPGEHFPWDRLAQEGVGHWVQPGRGGDGRYFARGDEGQPVEALQAMLALYGYGVPVSGVFCEKTHVVVEAFQRHFRQQRVDGVADASTVETLYRLILKRDEDQRKNEQ